MILLADLPPTSPQQVSSLYLLSRQVTLIEPHCNVTEVFSCKRAWLQKPAK